MGGYGSGQYQQRNARLTTGDTVRLPLSAFTRAGALTWNKDIGGQIKIKSFALAFQIVNNVLTLSNNGIKQGIALCSTTLVSGGLRVWYSCPRCLKRSTVLYLVPGAHTFSCWQCAELVQKSKRIAPKFSFQQQYEQRTERVKRLIELDTSVKAEKGRRKL